MMSLRPQQRQLDWRMMLKPKKRIFLAVTISRATGSPYSRTHFTLFGNIQKVFTKFVSEGKATIRFITPPHDVIINTTAVELAHFLKIIQLCLNADVPLKSIKFSVPSKKIPGKVKNQLKILKKSEYPVNGFPRNLEVLEVISLDQNQVDPRILCLENLTTLNMSQNNLQKIPEEINLLNKLSVLVLSKNLLGRGRHGDWMWVNGGNLARSLKKLDLACNEMKFIPDQIVKLRALTCLDISQNNLDQLPPGLGKLSNLRFLNIASNELTYLPCSARMLNLQDIDISQNTWIVPPKVTRLSVIVPSLREYAARVVVNKRVPYTHHDVPLCMSHYLDTAKYCVCRSACFDERFESFCVFNLMDISSSVTHEVGRSQMVPMQITFCSVKCRFKYKGNDHSCGMLTHSYAY
ncbi:leucine-rich repeat protein 1 isoform X2 [Anabrus simplex]|uniref:leucine-rich repeat protein 1 isoform X2 n=1 Tax=Anabrus simplex TaxID=316456 RepID=UPI0034DD3CAB